MRERPLRHGQSLVEFAIILPVLLTMCMGAIDLGRVYFAHVALVGAVEQGARLAAWSPASSDTDVRAAVVNEPGATILLSSGSVTITPSKTETIPPTDRPKGSTVTVTATTAFPLLTPVMHAAAGRSSITLTASASMVVQ